MACPMHPPNAVADNWTKNFSWMVDTAVMGGGGGGDGCVSAGVIDEVRTGLGALENPAVVIFCLACFNFFFLDVLFKAVPAPNTLPANNMDVTERWLDRSQARILGWILVSFVKSCFMLQIIAHRRNDHTHTQSKLILNICEHDRLLPFHAVPMNSWRIRHPKSSNPKGIVILQSNDSLAANWWVSSTQLLVKTDGSFWIVNSQIMYPWIPWWIVSHHPALFFVHILETL